jgi:hypothetical protein
VGPYLPLASIYIILDILRRASYIYLLLLVPYHAIEIKSNGTEVEREHSEKVKSVSKSIDVTAECLFAIAICHFSFKDRYLIHSYMTALTDLHVFMVCNMSSSHN